MNDLSPDARTVRLHGDLDEVRRVLTDYIEGSISELQNALTHVSVSRAPLDSQLAKLALAEFATGDQNIRVHADIVMTVVCEYYGFTIDQLRGRRKTAGVAKARQIGMYLCRELTGQSFPGIGGEFDRDHTTVMYAVAKIRGEVAEGGRVAGQVADLVGFVQKRSELATQGVS